MASNNTSFKAGQSGNPAGGSKTRRIKKQLESLIEKALPRIEEELESASPDDRCSFFLDLAKITLPNKTQRA